jgi:hypothetical protein
MKVLGIWLRDGVVDALVAAAKKERRTKSNFGAILLETEMRRRGLLTPDGQESAPAPERMA